MKKLLAFIGLTVLLLTGCSRNQIDDKNLVIGCSPSPHSEILEFVKPMIEKEGYTVEIKVINDYVTPNRLLEDGDLDANYFQHVPYLDDFNKKNGTHLTWLEKVHFEPMGIYSLKHTDLNKANPKIAIPNDVSNGDRAKALLKEYNVAGSVLELEAQSLPTILTDVDYAVINGNYALESKIVDKCLATESSDSDVALQMANVIAVKETAVDQPWTAVLSKVVKSKELHEFIVEKYGSSVKPIH